MKAFIDRQNSELITIGYEAELAREQAVLLGLKRWAWIDDDRAIPDTWEAITIPLDLQSEQIAIKSLSEQIQEDLITMMAAQFEPLADGDPWLAEQIQHIQDLACQIVVDNFNKFKSKE